MKHLNKTCLILTLFTIASSGILHSKSGQIKVGEVTGVDKKSGEIIVGSPSSGDTIKMGDLLYVRIDGKIVQLRAVFPMMTISKCKAEGKNRALWKMINKGMPVYRFTDGTTDSTEVNINESAVDAENRIYKVGDHGPAGGWIFYDKGDADDGWRYLEASPEDLSEGIQWYNGKTMKIGTTEKSVGSGKSNTQNIIAVQGKGKYAAYICANYKGGGKSDWFLPSKEELEILYKFLVESGISGSSNDYYWSSTEYDADYAWYTGVNLSYPGGTKYSPNMVRAVRAFGK